MRLRVAALASLLLVILTVAIVGRGAGQASGDVPTLAMNQAISDAATQETRGELHVDRIDYVGRHDDGAGAVAFIFYVYLSDHGHPGYERFVRVLRTADGTLHVLTA